MARSPEIAKYGTAMTCSSANYPRHGAIYIPSKGAKEDGLRVPSGHQFPVALAVASSSRGEAYCNTSTVSSRNWLAVVPTVVFRCAIDSVFCFVRSSVDETA